MAELSTGNGESVLLEWRLVELEVLDEETSHCLCGHVIKELCHVENVETKHKVVLGNVCIHHLLGVNYAAIFRCLKKVLRDMTSKVNVETLEYMRSRGTLTNYEYVKSLETLNKRKLTPFIRHLRLNVNAKIVEELTTVSRLDNFKRCLTYSNLHSPTPFHSLELKKEGVLNEWEVEFMANVRDKLYLSEKQENKIRQINQKVLNST
jgi:hypothetical protein